MPAGSNGAHEPFTVMVPLMLSDSARLGMDLTGVWLQRQDGKPAHQPQDHSTLNNDVPSPHQHHAIRIQLTSTVRCGLDVLRLPTSSQCLPRLQLISWLYSYVGVLRLARYSSCFFWNLEYTVWNLATIAELSAKRDQCTMSRLSS